MNIMLDLETMGNGSNAAIVAIGAVAFDIRKRELGAEFYQLVTLESSMEAGGVCDASTILWWMGQSEEARRCIIVPPGAVPIAVALQKFSCWYDRVAKEDGEVWGNGATADNVWLANAYRRLNLPVPWFYRKDRCYRTVKALHPEVERKPYGIAHNALDDAKGQALHLIEMLNPLPNEAHT